MTEISWDTPSNSFLFVIVPALPLYQAALHVRLHFCSPNYRERFKRLGPASALRPDRALIAKTFNSPHSVQLYSHNAQVHWEQRWQEPATERLLGGRSTLQHPPLFESALNQLHFPIVLNRLPSNITSLQWLSACVCVRILCCKRNFHGNNNSSTDRHNSTTQLTWELFGQPIKHTHTHTHTQLNFSDLQKHANTAALCLKILQSFKLFCSFMIKSWSGESKETKTKCVFVKGAVRKSITLL